MKRIILASKSPRRKALLRQIGLSFDIVPSDSEEKLNPRLKPRGNAEQLSLEKAKAVEKKIRSKATRNEEAIDAIIIAADTFVVFRDEILGKPKNKKEAIKMLQKFSGTSHSVITGFTIMDMETGKVITDSVVTKVWFRKLSKEEIESYVASGEPMGKAGAYALQEKGAVFVDKIEGDPFNVVGLPLNSVAENLKKFEVKMFTTGVQKI